MGNLYRLSDNDNDNDDVNIFLQEVFENIQKKAFQVAFTHYSVTLGQRFRSAANQTLDILHDSFELLVDHPSYYLDFTPFCTFLFPRKRERYTRGI